jgi:hypothetical protein
MEQTEQIEKRRVSIEDTERRRRKQKKLSADNTGKGQLITQRMNCTVKPANSICRYRRIRI